MTKSSHLFPVDDFNESIPKKKLRGVDKNETSLIPDVIPKSGKSKIFSIKHNIDDQELSEASHNSSPTPNSAHKSSNSGSESESDIDTRPVIASRKGQKDEKSKLIAKILCRWWYVLPPWPPEGYDYSVVLKERKLIRIDLENWEVTDDVDANGFAKVYEIQHFPGVFRDAQGNAIDLRPLENKPCYSTFAQKPDFELYKLLITALNNQLKALRNSSFRNTDFQTYQKIENSLTQELQIAEKQLAQLK